MKTTATPPSFSVIMVIVCLKAMSVTTLMIVEITVMKRTVVVVHQLVRYNTLTFQEWYRRLYSARSKHSFALRQITDTEKRSARLS